MPPKIRFSPLTRRPLPVLLFLVLAGTALSGCGNREAATTPEQQQQKATDAAAAAKTDALNREALRKQQQQSPQK